MIFWGFQLPVVSALGTVAAYLIVLVISLRKRSFFTWLYGIFDLYLVLSILWSIGRALTIWRGLVYQVPQAGWEMAFSAIIVLPVVLVALTMLFFEWPRVHWAAIGGGGAALLVALIDVNVGGIQEALQRALNMSSPKDVLHLLRWIIWGGFSAGALGATIWGYAITRRPLHRNRILYWLGALLFITIGESLTLTANPVNWQFGIAVRVLGVLLMVFVLVRYYLPSLRTVAQQSFLTTSVTLVTGLMYLLGFLLVRQALALPEPLQLIVIGVIALGMAILTPPVRRVAQSLIGNVLFGSGYDTGRTLREYSAAISNVLDLETLVTISIGVASEAMETKRGALWLITERLDQRVDVQIIPGMGDFKIKSAEFTPNSPILNYLRTSGQPLTQYEIDFLPQFRSASPFERAWLQDIEMELYVPIRQQNVLVGVIALGDKAGGVPYSAQDLDLLYTLADQTTVALQNARLVTDLKDLNAEMARLNEELKQTNLRLEKMDAAKSDFIQIASHELRTPITQVRGYADILADSMQTGTPTAAQVLKISQGISRATQRLEEIITAMLDVSQIDVQSLDLNRAPLALTTVIRMAMDPYREGAAQRKQTLAVERLEGLPPVPGDLQRLCQAFGNIIVNCIKFTPDGGKITITGRTFETLDDNGVKSPFVEVVISDTGVGIDKADHDLIFEKFYRVGSPSLHSTGTTKFLGAGPGLGLPIARGVIEAHGGRVWVESEGRDEKRCPGSQFHVILPAATLQK